MTQDARVIVIGGGAFGTSIAYHLAQLGLTDILLLDRFGLADGTTWHSGGFVGQLRSEVPIMQLIAHSSQVYSDLAGGPDGDGELDWHRVGSLRLATTDERFAEFTRLVGPAGHAGVPASLISPEGVAELAPILETEDLVGAVWIPTDGYLEPDTLPRCFARNATAAGVTIRTGVDVHSIAADSAGVVGVNTSEGLVRAGQVIVAAGFATPELLATAGVFVPIGVSRQQYLITTELPTDITLLPTVREPDRSQYFRCMGRQVLLGAIAGEAGLMLPKGMPREARYLFEPLEHGLDPAWETCRQRLPALRAVEIDRIVRGPEGVTPDGELIADETSIPGLWVAAGGSGHGIAAAGGVGWYISALVGRRLDPRIDGPTVDGAFFALGRFPDAYRTNPTLMLETMEQCELAHYRAVEPADTRF